MGGKATPPLFLSFLPYVEGKKSPPGARDAQKCARNGMLVSAESAAPRPALSGGSRADARRRSGPVWSGLAAG